MACRDDKPSVPACPRLRSRVEALPGEMGSAGLLRGSHLGCERALPVSATPLGETLPGGVVRGGAQFGVFRSVLARLLTGRGFLRQAACRTSAVRDWA